MQALNTRGGLHVRAQPTTALLCFNLCPAAITMFNHMRKTAVTCTTAHHLMWCQPLRFSTHRSWLREAMGPLQSPMCYRLAVAAVLIMPLYPSLSSTHASPRHHKSYMIFIYIAPHDAAHKVEHEGRV